MARKIRPALPALLALALLPSFLLGVPTAAGPPGMRGAVAAEHPLAAAAGLGVLRAGGNAVDAAVATALALAVVYPEAGNLGGGGFAVVRLGGELRALDFRETAPAAATPRMFLDAAGKPIPGASLVGPLAAGVPGSPAGLYELQRKLGRLSWAEVVAPARRLAAEGFAVDRHLHAVLDREKTRQLLGRFPETAAVWLPGGQPLPAGSQVRLPALAATLGRYAAAGPAAFAEGPLAAAIAAAAHRHGGILTAADLAAYRPVWRQPLTFEALGWSFAAMPLPSSGGIILEQTFGMLAARGWAALPRGGADRAHLLAEAFRRAYADRFLLGDPATTRATAAQLVDPRWIARRAQSIDPGHATPSASLHAWGEAEDEEGEKKGARKAATRAPGGDGAAAPESQETTHLSVIDGEGNLVALTTTLNALFGCGLYVPEVGIFLNDEMDDFTTAPGQPNLFGLIQGEANAVAPGKRMLSAMTPTLAWRGEEAVAIGGRGGSRIPTHTAQVLLDLLVDHDPLATAVERPRLHHQWQPDRLEAEPGALAGAVRAELERRGHTVKESGESTRVNAVRRLPGGRDEAAVDPRDSALPPRAAAPDGSTPAAPAPDRPPRKQEPAPR
jgi:gamma-glutamyltranspeptidase/glutathione hydrolase